MAMRHFAHALSACALSGFTFAAAGQVASDHVLPPDAELFPPEITEEYVASCVCHNPPDEDDDGVAGRGHYLNSLWPNRTVYYEFFDTVSLLNRQRTLAAMAELERVCQVRFVERDEQENYILIYSGFGNSSDLGFRGGVQFLEMYNWSSKFIIVHELMHALGMAHEHQRPDASPTFVTINYENVFPGFADQFEPERGTFVHGPYDYESIMHYDAFAFSANGQPTIIATDPAYQDVIGNRNELSEGDIAALAFLYGPAIFASNNDCANATMISGDGVQIFDNSAATMDGPTDADCPGFADGVDNDVWFMWTAEKTGPATVSTCGQTDVNTRLAVYAGSECATSPLVACGDAGCGFGASQAQAAFAAVEGQQYLIRIGTPPAFAGGFGTFTITTQVGGATNDNCLSAPEIEGFGQFDYDSSAANTDGSPSESCNFFGQADMEHDVWFSWTSPITGDVTVSTCGQTTVDTKLAVIAGGCNGSVLACADDACESLQAEVRFSAVADETYLIRVGSHPGTPGGAGVLTIDNRPPAPANNACFAAAPIGLGQTPFSNISASTDGPLEPALCTPRADIWYVFTPTVAGDYTLSTCGADFDTVLLIYSGDSCGFDDPIAACNDNACEFGSQATFTAEANTSYLVRLGGAELAQGSGVLTVAAAEPPCACDLVDDGAIDVFDLLAYLDLWFAADHAADIDEAAGVDVFDLLAYLDCWFAGC